MRLLGQEDSVRYVSIQLMDGFAVLCLVFSVSEGGPGLPSKARWLKADRVLR